MKPGARALGIAESYVEDHSTVCGAVGTGQGLIDEFAFRECTVGGADITDTILELWQEIDREDVQLVLISGVALAWYNIIDLDCLERELPVPVLALTYEESDGLEPAIERAFDGAAAQRRLALFRALPDRQAVDLGDETIYVRTAGSCPDPEASLRVLTQAGGRPEPVRVARLAARAAHRYRHGREPDH